MNALEEALAVRQLAALSEIGQTIVSGVGYEGVLEALIEKVARLLRARGGGFMLYHEESGELVTQRPAFGLSDELVDAYHVSLSDGGNAATVFVTGEPYVTNDVRDDPRVLHHFAELHGIRKLVTVPLQVEGRAIGVLHVVDKYEGDFGDEDVALMTLIAPQLAVIIQSAGVMRQLRDRERQLGRALEVHEELIDMLLSGEGPPGLVRRLTQLLRMPVCLADRAGAIVAGDAAALERAGSSAAAVEELLVESLDPASSPDDLERHRCLPWGDGSLIVVPVHARREVVGHLAVLDRDEAASAEDLRVMQQAAMLFALEIMRERQLTHVRRRLDTDILEHVFRAESVEEANALLRRLGVAEAEAYRCARLELLAPTLESALAAGFQSIKSSAYRQLLRRLGQTHGDVAVVERGNAFWLVMPHLPERDPERDRADLRLFAARVSSEVLARGEYEFLMGIGGVVPVTDLSISFDQAAKAIEVCRQGGPRSAAVFYDELGVYGLLAQPAGVTDLTAFVADVLGPVLEYDEANDANWLDFMRVVVEENFGITAAAARSGLHLNTVKYRVSRLQALLERDFSVAADRFDIQLALRIVDLQQLLEPASGATR